MGRSLLGRQILATAPQNLARLTEETGELARAVNQQYGQKRIKSERDVADIEIEPWATCSSPLAVSPTAPAQTSSAVSRLLSASTGRETKVKPVEPLGVLA